MSSTIYSKMCAASVREEEDGSGDDASKVVVLRSLPVQVRMLYLLTHVLCGRHEYSVATVTPVAPV